MPCHDGAAGGLHTLPEGPPQNLHPDTSTRITLAASSRRSFRPLRRRTSSPVVVSGSAIVVPHPRPGSHAVAAAPSHVIRPPRNLPLSKWPIIRRLPPRNDLRMVHGPSLSDQALVAYGGASSSKRACSLSWLMSWLCIHSWMKVASQSDDRSLRRPHVPCEYLSHTPR